MMVGSMIIGNVWNIFVKSPKWRGFEVLGYLHRVSMNNNNLVRLSICWTTAQALKNRDPKDLGILGSWTHRASQRDLLTKWVCLKIGERRVIIMFRLNGHYVWVNMQFCTNPDTKCLLICIYIYMQYIDYLSLYHHNLVGGSFVLAISHYIRSYPH